MRNEFSFPDEPLPYLEPEEEEGVWIKRELARVIVSEEKGPKDLEIPEVNAEVFGPFRGMVDSLLKAYRDWSARVYVNDHFHDHNDRRAWRRSLREAPAHAKEAREALRVLEKRNKYRIAPTAGLWTLFNGLREMLSEGTVDDKRLEKSLQKAFTQKEYDALYEGYELPETTNGHRQEVNAVFGEKLAKALLLIAEEAGRRKPIVPSVKRAA